MGFIVGEDSMVRAHGTDQSWHGLETVSKEHWTIDDWQKAAGLDFRVLTEQAHVRTSDGMFRAVPNCFHQIREDNGALFGTFTKRYKSVQPKQICEFFQNYILQDERFKLDTMGALKGGKVVWCLARFNGTKRVVSADHEMYAFLATSFDGTMATRCSATAIRAVCRNTVPAAAYSDESFAIRHSTEFNDVNQAKALETLENVVRQFDQYSEFAETLAGIRLGKEQTFKLFERLLEIEEGEEVATRTDNIRSSLIESLNKTLKEPGTGDFTAWTALNAVTRYADHSKTAKRTIEGETANQARLFSAQFGSGMQMKMDMVNILQEYADKEFVPA